MTDLPTERRRILQAAGIAATSIAPGIQIVSASEQPEEQPSHAVHDLHMINNYHDKVSINLDIVRGRGDNRGEKVYTRKFTLSPSRGEPREGSYFKGYLESNSGKRGWHTFELESEIGESTAESVGFSRDGIPPKVLLSVEVTDSGDLSSAVLL